MGCFCFYFSAINEAGPKFLITIICIFVVGVFLFHLTEFQHIPDLKKKSTDFKAPIYGFVGFSITAIGAAGFGKPYSPLIVGFCGLIFMVIIGRAYPGMFEWLDKLVLILTALTLVIEYGLNVYRYGRWYSGY